jgi:hypothetical protein
MTPEREQKHSILGGLLSRPALASVGIVALAALILASMGRVWWCKCGLLNLWSGEIASMHNSQHLMDPYTFTHILHGIGFYALLWALLGKRTSRSFRFVLAIGFESFWEIVENTSMVIERYRETTISLGYYGDSIANSIADIAACALGFGLAIWLPVWGSIALFFGIEGFLLWWIRDSLLLNILMLLWPLESVRNWQGGV